MMKNKSSFNEWLHSSATIKVALMTVVVIWAVVLIMLIGGTTFLLERPSQALQTTPDAFTSPAISLNPTAASAGSSVTVNGKGWPAGAKVLIYLADTEATPYALSGVTVDEAGQFATDLIFPSDPRWQKKELVQVLAQTADNGISTQAILAVISPLEPDAVLPTTLPTQTPSPISTEPSATAIPIVAPTTTLPASTTPLLTTNTDLNVRGGPGTYYPVLGILRGGQTAQITGLSMDKEWWQVRFSGTLEGQGWVLGRYVTAQNTANVPLVQVNTPPVSTPTATPQPAATSTPVVIYDWRGEYYNNVTLGGAPVMLRNDGTINFNWGTGSPAANVPADNFSARWTRSLYFDSGVYRFFIRVDDGARLWVDNHLVIDAWYDAAARDVIGEITLGSGTHNLRVEYYERAGDARVGLWWEKVASQDDNDNDDNDNDDNDNNDNDDEDDEDYSDWKGEYYSDRDLDDREFTRNDEDIDFDWEDDSPRDLPTDNFSVRWSRWYNFAAGRYRFEARADDGIRVYVDGRRVIDEWHNSDGDELYTVELDLVGPHWLVVEYYERSREAKVEVDPRRVGDIATPTQTPTATPTQTPTPTATSTWTPTATTTPAQAPTEQPTTTPASTMTTIPTNTTTPASTITSTPLPTHTPTEEPTATATNTPSALPTSTPTEVPSATPLPTNTPTEEPTATATNTPSALPTSTPTEVPSATPLPTNTPTQEPTSTPTNSPEPSPTIATSPTLTGTITTTLTLTPTSLVGTP